jgi:hypothetical protein
MISMIHGRRRPKARPLDETPIVPGGISQREAYRGNIVHFTIKREYKCTVVVLICVDISTRVLHYVVKNRVKEGKKQRPE